MTKHFATSILVCLIVFTALLAPLFVGQAQASDGGGSWAMFSAFYTKEYVLDLIARVIAQRLYVELNDGISKLVATGGPDGGPTWVKQWGFFIRKAQDQGRGAIKPILGEAVFHPERKTICDTFGPDLARMFKAKLEDPATNYNSALRILDDKTFAQINRCSLPKEVTLSDGKKYTQAEFAQMFRKDMRFGGWAAYDQFIQPENNFFNVYANTLEEQLKQQEHTEKQKIDEVLANGGFEGIKDGDDNVKTPGSVLKEAASAAITKEFDWLTVADELDEVIIGSVNVVFDKLKSYVTDVSSERTTQNQKLPDKDCQKLCNAYAGSECNVDFGKSLSASCTNTSTGQKCSTSDLSACVNPKIQECKTKYQCSF